MDEMLQDINTEEVKTRKEWELINSDDEFDDKYSCGDLMTVHWDKKEMRWEEV